jgi:hypothetical protein
MKRSPFIAGLICVLTSLAVPASLVAQAPPPLESHLFIVYALADLVRTDLPDDLIKDPGRLARFHAFQQLQADKVIFYLSREQNRETKLIEPLEGYRTWLSDVKKLVQTIEVTKRKNFEAFLAAKLKINYEQIASNNAAQMSGLSYALNALGQGESGADAFFVAQGAAAAKAIEGQIKIEAARAEALELHRKAVGAFADELQALVAAPRAKLREQLAKLPALDETALQALSDKYNWNTPIANKRREWDSDADRPRDPFLIESVVRSRKTLEGLAGSDQHLRNAKDLLFASRLVPAGQEFSFYKARLLGYAGIEANHACADQVGKAGFSSINRKKERMPGAGLAQSIWKGYTDLTPTQPWNDRELSHRIFLAYAFGSSKDAQHALVRLAAIQKSMAPIPQRASYFSLRWVPSPNQPSNPDFWYDAACLCGSQRFTAQAFVCLDTAVRLGFDKKEEAMVNLDLEPLRAANASRFRLILDPKE